MVTTSRLIEENKSVALTGPSMVFIALLTGGDYNVSELNQNDTPDLTNCRMACPVLASVSHTDSHTMASE